MKRLFLIAGILLAALSPLACQKTYTLGPLNVPTPTPTASIPNTSTNTSTITLTHTPSGTPTQTPSPTVTNTPSLTSTTTSTPTVTSTPHTNGGVVSTFAGSGAVGSANGVGVAASFNNPSGLAIDSLGNLYVADSVNNKIRKITPGGLVSTFAGTGGTGPLNGPATTLAEFDSPAGVAVDNAGNVYVADYLNNFVREISSGLVSTIAGSGGVGSANGPAATATFFYTFKVAVDSLGNVYVSDYFNNSIRKIAGGVVSTFSSSFWGPGQVAVDSSDNLYVADGNNNMIKKVTPAGVVSTFAGTGAVGSANGNASLATFNKPVGVAVDSWGTIYVADSGNYLIRKITGGIVSTLAGSGSAGSANGVGTAASFSTPYDLAVDSLGNVYVADTTNQRIRVIQ